MREVEELCLIFKPVGRVDDGANDDEMVHQL